MRAVGAYALGKSALDDTILRMTTTIHGGLADTKQGRCGALLAGLLIVGALFGRVHPDEDDTQAKTVARQYWQRFVEEFGSDHCATLRNTGRVGPEYPSVCGTIMVRATGILVDLLEELAAQMGDCPEKENGLTG